MLPTQRILFLQQSPRSVTQNSLTPDILWVIAASLPFCLPGWRHPRELPDVLSAASGKESLAKQARGLKRELGLAHGCLWNTATVTGGLKESHRKFSHQAPASWEITRAQGSWLEKIYIMKTLFVLWKQSTRGFQKAQVIKTDGDKAQ